jgi:hypothetical protein
MRTLAVIAFLFLPSMCLAGNEKDFVCRHCDLTGTYGVGGGFFFSEFPAFCTNKAHFVSISWGRDERKPKPVRVEGSVRVFRCPQCKTMTARRWDQKECPRCGSTNIKIRDGKMFYD